MDAKTLTSKGGVIGTAISVAIVLGLAFGIAYMWQKGKQKAA